MTATDIDHLEALVSYIAFCCLEKRNWKEVSKAEWQDISEYLNRQLVKLSAGNNRASKIAVTIGENYIYEHLVIRKLNLREKGANLESISNPHSRLNAICRALGFEGYIEFIQSVNEKYPFNALRINIPNINEKVNEVLLANLEGHW